MIFFGFERSDDRFKFHLMDKDQKMYSDKLREKIANVADIIDIYCPDGREKDLALTKLEECLMWVNKSLSRN